jgi:calcium permeable stress-gated cation channel
MRLTPAGFILYMVVRECVYSINIRQAYLMSPFYAERLSSRTVLFTCVPRQYLNEARLRVIFGTAVKRVWLPRDTEDLEHLVKERDQTALRLEKAEFELIKLANSARTKAGGDDFKTRAETSEMVIKQRKRSAVDFFKPKEGFEVHTPTQSVEHTLPDVSGSVASQWIPHSARPHHRPLGNWGKRVDTIKWTRMRLKTLAWQIKKERRKVLSRQENILPSVFLEFHNQRDAQIACQTLSHHRPLHMSQRYIGVRPYEILWASLSMPWWSRIVRKFSMRAFIVMMIIFWSLPCALVGLLSNIKSISHKIIFLHWILDLPSPILGLIEGLVPAVALSLLMSTAPWICRCELNAEM